MTLTFLKCTGSYCAECPSIWVCIIFPQSSGYIFLAGIAQKWCVFLSASHRTHMMLFCPIIENVSCDHLVKMMSDRFLHVKVIPFVICKWSVRKYLVCINILFLIVLIHTRCYKKLPETGWLIDKRHLFCTVLETGKSKIKAPEDLVSGDGPPPGS